MPIQGIQAHPSCPVARCAAHAIPTQDDANLKPISIWQLKKYYRSHDKNENTLKRMNWWTHTFVNVVIIPRVNAWDDNYFLESRISYWRNSRCLAIIFLIKAISDERSHTRKVNMLIKFDADIALSRNPALLATLPVSPILYPYPK